MTPNDIRIGDLITFKPLCRWPTRTETRKVTGLSPLGWPEVSSQGSTGFVVRPSEITAVQRHDT